MKLEDLKEVKKNSVGSGLLIEHDGYVNLNEGKNKLIKEAHETADGWYCPYPFVVSAVFQKYDTKNANGRIYPKDVLVPKVEEYQQLIRDHMALGELNHPESSTIDLGRISHNITELHWEGKTLVGELELNVSQGFVNQGIVSTCGDHAANLLLNGYKIGVSSRAVGSVENKMGVLVVDSSLEIICWDIVATPSTKNSYIGKNREELEPYIESKDLSNKSQINEKINLVKKILN